MNSTKNILFVDDDPQFIEMLAEKARGEGWQAFTAQNAWTAVEIMEGQALDAICLDVQMPTANGLSIADMAAKSPDTAHIPLVILTGRTDDETRRRCAELRAHYVAKGSDTWPRLQSVLLDLFDAQSALPAPADHSAQNATELVFEMLGVSENFLTPGQVDTDQMNPDLQFSTTPPNDQGSAEPWVLCVEDDRDFSLALQMRLKKHGISVVRAFEGVEGIKTALTRPAEAIILDFNLPNGRGDYVLRRLKANPLTHAIPVIVVSGQKRNGLEKEMLHLGAARFFAKPVRFEELLDELKRHVPVIA